MQHHSKRYTYNNCYIGLHVFWVFNCLWLKKPVKNGIPTTNILYVYAPICFILKVLKTVVDIPFLTCFLKLNSGIPTTHVDITVVVGIPFTTSDFKKAILFSLSSHIVVFNYTIYFSRHILMKNWYSYTFKQSIT